MKYNSLTQSFLWYSATATFVIAFFLYGVLTSIPTQRTYVTDDKVALPPPELTTQAWGIFDVETGEVILGKNIDAIHPIASITKLFTAEAVMKSSVKDIPVMVNWADINEEGRAGKLSYGESTTPYQLLFPLLLESSNDAAHAIKRALGSGYDSTITELTRELPHTKIKDSSGMSSTNVSTIRELASYYVHLKTFEPHIIDITQLGTFIDNRTGYLNNDPAKHFDSFRGGKHGYTDESGRTFVGTFARENGVGEFGIILLGSNDLTSDISALIRYGETR